MNDPILSVLVPAHNAELFIQPTLDSLSSQTLTNFSAYISIDKSDDKTLEICSAHAQKDPRFQVITHHERLGWVGNSNFLLSLIKTPYALFAFHDDLLDSTYFSKLVAALELNNDAAVAFSDTLLTNVNGSQELWVYSELDGVDDPMKRAESILDQQGKWWVPNRGIFRYSFAKKINGLKTHDSGEFSADLPWLFHLGLYGRMIRIHETLCFKHYKPGSLSKSWKFNKKAKYDVLASCMRELWIAEIDMKIKIALAGPLLRFLVEKFDYANAKDNA